MKILRCWTRRWGRRWRRGNDGDPDVQRAGELVGVGAFYYQQVGVGGMLDSDNPVADILPGGDNAANKLYADAWGKVQRIDTLEGAVKLLVHGSAHHGVPGAV